MSLEAFLIRPVTIGDEQLVSSNAVETATLWDDGDTGSSWSTRWYAARGSSSGDIVRSGENNHIYESIVGTGFDSGLCSMTNANPCVVTTATPHGLSEYDPVTFTDVGTGSFPASVEVGRPYLVHVLSTTTFNLYDDMAEPIDASFVDTSADSGSGLHAYAGYDLNTGWWGDPGADDYENNSIGLGSWVTWPRWLDRGPDNTRAMFDALIGTATTWEGDGEVTIAPGTRCDAIGFEGLVGASLRVVVRDGATTEYDQTVSLIDNSEVVDWYTFIYGERRQRETKILSDLPSWVPTPEIDITLEASNGISAIGAMQVGRQFPIGMIEMGLGLAIEDFTLKERDPFGVWSVTERDCAKTAEGTAWLSNARRPALHKVLRDVRATPVFWSFGDDEDQQILGFFNSYDSKVSEGNVTLTSYEIEGVI